MARMVGRKIKPWRTPNVTNPMKATKILLIIALVLKTRSMTPKKVEIAPTRIDAPIVESVSTTRCSRVPLAS